MPQPKNAMEVFQVLDKSNCQECGQKTCLAFAGAVYKGQKNISECPRLDRKTIERFSSDASETANSIEQNREDYLNMLKSEISRIDFEEAAKRTGGHFAGDKLTIKVFGKDFSVDTQGNIHTDIHVNPWVAVPFLNYILYGKGLMPSGNWVPFRELKDGKERYPLFKKRCEEPMKRIADIYTDFFDDIVRLFNGKQVDKQFQSDISVVLYPLPKLPIMICYWQPEENLESSLNLFFDKTAEENLDNGAVFTLGAGLAQMFEKLAHRHGFQQTNAHS